MWFKNLLMYRFTKPFTLSAEQLGELLQGRELMPCSSQDKARHGWVPPVGVEGAPLVHGASGRMMVCLQRQEKLLPAAVINEVLAERVDEIRDAEDRRVGRKERQELKDQIVFELLPRAFARTNKLFAYVDPDQQLLVVNSASYTRAEELISALRESVGSLPLIPVKPANTAEQAMTHWLKSGTNPKDLSLGGECELRDNSDESAVIRCKNQDLRSAEIRSHLDAGMFVNRLELAWDGGIECVVDAKLAVKRLRFGDLITEKADEVDAESAAEQFDVDFAIMTGEFSRFIPALMACFGGMEKA